MFRPEALEHRARAHSAGGELRIGPRWADKAFWVLLALVAAALVAGLLIRIDGYASGPVAVAPDGRALILIPAIDAGSLEVGDGVDIGGVGTAVESISERTLGPAAVERRFGLAVQGPSVIVTTGYDGSLDATSARVVTNSDPILSLIPGLGALFGGDDG